ncbi:MAG: ornithine--oxo-acid transaminase [Thiobacillaceae bacterium]|nr:ornithine--oxo-acid transaminase [Thiobacillaceae bacterium]
MEARFGAANYAPLPVVLTRGRGVWVWDSEGRRYLDMMGAYSALAFGHAHPRLTAALCQQARRLALTSRAFHNDRLGPFLARACAMTGMDRALPMNSGAEGVETAIKAARRWAYRVKGVPEDRAEIIVCAGNFHGRTTTIIGFSSVPAYRDGFGPYAPGFRLIPYGDAQALEAVITPYTAAFLVEPIQGEAGIVVPPPGWLARCAEICRRHGVLLIADEVQTGLGRTGRLLACAHEGVRPDGLILGKALGGGLVPISLFLARAEVMAVFTPGSHGSTFGGNPLACAVGLAALELIEALDLPARAAQLGARLMEGLLSIRHPAIRAVRGKGLLIGVELAPEIDAEAFTLRLMDLGLLTRAVHGHTLRLAPPLIITAAQIERALAILRRAFAGLPGPPAAS